MEPTPMSVRNKWLLGGAAAVLVTSVAVAAVALSRDDDSSQDVATDSAVTTTVAPQHTATTSPPTSEPTSTTNPEVVPVPGVAPASVVWPRPGHEARFDDPVAAARSFAVFYAGFTDPVIGAFMGGDNRSGELEVRPDSDATAPVTTVRVRIMDDDHWYVTGTITDDIELDAVGLGEDGAITCPGAVSITGSALAFEGHIDVRIDSFGPGGSRNEIGRGFGTGSGVPPAAPFQADVECDAPVTSGSPPDTGGVIMAWDEDAFDGHVRAVAVRPVSFAP